MIRSPEIKQINKKDGDLIALKNELEEAAATVSRGDLLRFGMLAKAGRGGAVAGKPGILGGLALGMLDSYPWLKARLAIIIHKMNKRGLYVRRTPAVLRLMGAEAEQAREQITEE